MSWNARFTPILSKRCITAAALTGMAAAALSMAGCGYGNNADTGTHSDSAETAGTIEGHLHTGSEPVAFATVKIYAAGSTGYGSQGTLLATTSSLDDSGGTFVFTHDPVPGHTYPNTGAEWACPDPATAGDPQVYIIANGGNTQNTHLNDTADTNTAASFIAAIGPCSTVTPGTVATMNEVTTAATVFSLAQYMNPGTTPGTESIGTKGLNLTAGGVVPQAVVGLNNAVASIANLASISAGSAVLSNSYPGTGATVTGATVTATPEASKLNTIANILAACGASQTASSANCAELFAAATPPTAASQTSQPSASFGAAQDLIQAGYYMAVNPANLGTQTTTCGGAASNTACLFSLASATPFATPAPLAAQPVDWTLAVTYTSTGSCPDGGGFLYQIYDANVDAMGNIWMSASVNKVTTSHIIEISPTGRPLLCVMGLNEARGVTIDIAGNVWAVSSNADYAVEYTTSGNTVTWPTTATGFAMTSDGSGNVFYTSDDNGTLNEFVGAATATSPSASVAVGAASVGTAELKQAKVDSAGRIYLPDYESHVWQFYPDTSGSAVNGYSYADIAAPLESATKDFRGAAIDASGNVYIGTTCCGTTAANSKYYKKLIKFAPTNGSATSLISPQYLGGFNGTPAMTIDGAGNVWVGSMFPATGTANHPGLYAVAEDYTTGTGTSGSWLNLSPAASNAANLSPTSTDLTTLCSATSDTDGGCPQGGGFQHPSLMEPYDMQIDIAGNVWVLNTGSESGTTGATYDADSVVEIVGAAVPTVAPLSVAAENGMLATKP